MAVNVNIRKRLLDQLDALEGDSLFAPSEYLSTQEMPEEPDFLEMEKMAGPGGSMGLAMAKPRPLPVPSPMPNRGPAANEDYLRARRKGTAVGYISPEEGRQVQQTMDVKAEQAKAAKNIQDQIFDQYLKLTNVVNEGEADAKVADDLRDLLLNNFRNAQQQQQRPYGIADALATMAIGFGGGLSGGLSGVPNTGHQITKTALDKMQEERAFRNRIQDMTPEVRGILAAMKMKDDRRAGYEKAKEPYIKALTDLASTLSKDTSEAAKSQKEFIEMIQQGRFKEAELMFKREQERSQREGKQQDLLKEYGKSIQPEVEKLQSWKTVANALGVKSLNQLSTDPTQNREIASKLKFNLGLPTSSWASAIDKVGMTKDEKAKMAQLRAAVEQVFGKVRHDLLGASQTDNELASWRSMTAQGLGSDTESALAAIAMLYGKHKLAVQNMRQTYGWNPKVAEQIDRYFPWGNPDKDFGSVEGKQPSEVRRELREMKMRTKGGR